MYKKKNNNINLAIYTNFFLGKQSTFVFREIAFLDQIVNLKVFAQRYSNKYFSISNIFVFDDHNNLFYRSLEKLVKKIKKKPFFNLSISKQWSKINFKDYDLIHIHFGGSALKLLESVYIDKPIVISIHGQDATKSFGRIEYRKSWLKILNRIHNKPHKIIFPSFFLRDAFVKNIDSKINFNTCVIPYGVDFKEIHSSSKIRKNNVYTFIQVSGFQKKKGHIYSIKAFKKLIDSGVDAKLIFVGSGDEEHLCEKIVRQLDLSNHIDFLGFKKFSEISDLLLRSNAFIHHSITDDDGDTEGLPNAIIEALGYGLPVLSSYHSGIPEIVKHGENGLLAQEKDVHQIFLNMKKIMSDNKIKPDINSIKNKYGIKNHCNLILETYNDLLGTGNEYSSNKNLIK